MSATTQTRDDETAMNENQFGNEFTLSTTYDNNLQIVEEFNDGSTRQFTFDPGYNYSVVRVGNDDTVMLEREFNDGSTRTQNVPTEWFESIKGALEQYLN